MQADVICNMDMCTTPTVRTCMLLIYACMYVVLKFFVLINILLLFFSELF